MMLQARCPENLQVLGHYVNLATKAWAYSVILGSALTVPVLYFGGQTYAPLLLFLIIAWSAALTLPFALCLAIPLMLILRDKPDRRWYVAGLVTSITLAILAALCFDPQGGLIALVYSITFTRISVKLRSTESE